MTQKIALVSAIGALVLLSLGGCPQPGTRTCDGGCSTPAQATGKLLSNNLGGMNQDDVQVLGDLAIEIAGANIPAVTNEQGDAVVSFFQANNINTIQDLEEVVHKAEEEGIEAIEIPEDVLAVLEAIAANQDQYADLQNADWEAVGEQLEDELGDQL